MAGVYLALRQILWVADESLSFGAPTKANSPKPNPKYQLGSDGITQSKATFPTSKITQGSMYLATKQVTNVDKRDVFQHLS